MYMHSCRTEWLAAINVNVNLCIRLHVLETNSLRMVM